jgi:hypothetical protein
MDDQVHALDSQILKRLANESSVAGEVVFEAVRSDRLPEVRQVEGDGADPRGPCRADQSLPVVG